MSELSMPDTHGDLVRIHRLISRALDVSTENCRSLAQGAAMVGPIRDGFASYLQTFVNVVHGHHTVEDLIFFPFFRDRLPEVPFDAFASEHNTMKALLEDMSTAIDSMAADTKMARASARLHDLLVQVAQTWHPHIRGEESHFTEERVAAAATPEELASLSDQISQHNQEHSRPLELVVPFLLYNLEPEDRAIFSRQIPSFVVDELVPVTWKQQWEPMKPFLLR